MQTTLTLVRDVRYGRGRFRDPSVRADTVAQWTAFLADRVDLRHILQWFVADGRTAKDVASALNISLRQFYRLYSSMIDAIEAGTRRPASVVPVTSRVELELEHARTLLVHGRADDARIHLNRTLESRPGAKRAISAMLLLSRARADEAEFGDARSTIDRAIRLVGDVEPEARLQAVCDIAMAQSYLAYAGGFYDAALVQAEDAFERSRPDLGALTHHEIRSLARDRIYLGIVQQEGGASRRAIHHFREALELLRRLPTPPGAELSQAYVQLAITDTAFAENLTQSIEYAEEGLRIAQWHGLRHEEVWAHLGLALLQLMSGSNREALRSGEAALSIARAVFKGDPLARTLFVNTRLHTSIGSPKNGVAFLREAAPHVAPASLLGGIMEICQARVQQAIGDDDATVEAADRAIATMESRFPAHYVGIAYWARGEVRLRRGNAGAATDAERAVHYLERGSPLPDYARALELSAAATANPRHAAMAREVRAALLA